MQNDKPKTVRISADTMSKLGNHRVGFETPDECLNRLLSKNPCHKQEDEVTVSEKPEEEEDVVAPEDEQP